MFWNVMASIDFNPVEEKKIKQGKVTKLFAETAEDVRECRII